MERKNIEDYGQDSLLKKIINSVLIVSGIYFIVCLAFRKSDYAGLMVFCLMNLMNYVVKWESTKEEKYKTFIIPWGILTIISYGLQVYTVFF